METNIGLQKYLKIGRIVGTRGLYGELKVVSFCDTPEFFCSIKNLYFYNEFKSEKLDILNKRIFKNLVLLKLNEVDSIEKGQKLIGREIYMNKYEIKIPKDRYFVSDILGMEVIDANNNVRYGKIFNVIQNGFHDVYCIKDDKSKEYYLPAVKEMITSINLENNTMLVSPIKGIFNE